MQIYKWINKFSPFMLPLFLMAVVCSCGNEGTNKPEALIDPPKVVHTEPAADRAIDEPELSTFKKALIAGGLQDIFIGTGPFTVFAPTNDAFNKLGKDKVNELLKPENKDQLVTILIFHFVHGKYLANMLKSRSYKTINGKNVEVIVDDNGNIKVNNAQVIKTDMVGPNGVVHEVDTVLIP